MAVVDQGRSPCRLRPHKAEAGGEEHGPDCRSRSSSIDDDEDANILKGGEGKQQQRDIMEIRNGKRILGGGGLFFSLPSMDGVMELTRRHPIPFVLALCVLFFMGVEYTLVMIPPSSPPFDLGFLLTRPLHRLLAGRPVLNSTLAALNTVFVGMQTAYILWALVVEGRARATISTLFMFTCRGILGYCTQLPLPQGFLGSGMDFPVGNVSFFLFFSGHVAGGLIASLDMRRAERHQMAWAFDSLNVLQGLRLLATRGHYTIDLAVGAGAALLFDSLAAKYEENRRHLLTLQHHLDN